MSFFGIKDNFQTPLGPFGHTDTFTFGVILGVNDEMLRGTSEERLGPVWFIIAM